MRNGKPVDEVARLAGLLSLLAMQIACGGSTTVGGVVNPPGPNPVPFRVETFLSNLSFPVTMAFAPDGRLFYNELQTGNVRVVVNGVLQPQPFATLPVETTGERGLLGLAFDPQFVSNRFVYVLHSDPSGVQRVVRFTDSNGTGINLTVIVDNLPSAGIHNGGNIGFGRDGFLYITIGDSGDPANAQDPNSLSGKLLRYNSNGTVVATNPFGANNPAFNLGLRNSFDFTFHPQSGVVYASENGPNCDDEINRVVAGGNYGWRPNYPCGDTNPQFTAPITRFNPVIAPTGITFYTGNVFPQFTGSLFLVDFNEGRVRRFEVNEAAQGTITETEVVMAGGMGNLLDIVQGPDGALYFSSTTAILRIVPQ
ncbi:MAG TPA: PQQ-dependent sugar dehydrogenase [Candidatus Xenobia bacterium]|nr:PQQ-dependent sugar dehydrogenase [Candidatus Xenobia bacterium]